MADALASGASVRKGVGVQIPPRAPAQGSSRKWGTSVPESPGQASGLAGIRGCRGPKARRRGRFPPGFACGEVFWRRTWLDRSQLVGIRAETSPTGASPRVRAHGVLRDVFFETCSSGRSTAGPPRLQDSGVPGLLALEGPGRGLCSVRRPGRRVDPVPFEDDRLFVAATSNPMKMVRTTGSVPVVTSLGLPGCRGARGVAAPRDRANMDHALFVARGRRSSSASNDPRRSCRYSVRNRHRGYHCGSGHAARREEPRHRITG